PVRRFAWMLAAGIAACVPLLDEHGRPCPCTKDLRCVEGICMDLPPARCGDGRVEVSAGEECEQDDPPHIDGAQCVDCKVVCNDGFADCDEWIGCETRIDHPESCGSCFYRCIGDETACHSGRCTVVVSRPDQPVVDVASPPGEEEIFWLTEGSHSEGVHNG